MKVKVEISCGFLLESTKVIPTYLDVLCGTSTERFTQLGNELFISTVLAFVDCYQRASSKKDKMKVSKMIYDCLTKFGVRFLKKGVGQDQHWYLASEKVGRDRIGHSLRQYATKRSTDLPRKFKSLLTSGQKITLTHLHTSCNHNSKSCLSTMLLSVTPRCDEGLSLDPPCGDFDGHNESFQSIEVDKDNGISKDLPLIQLVPYCSERLGNYEKELTEVCKHRMVNNAPSQQLNRTSEEPHEDCQLFDDVDLAECLDWLSEPSADLKKIGGCLMRQDKCSTSSFWLA
jgi:hypothetical protein